MRSVGKKPSKPSAAERLIQTKLPIACFEWVKRQAAAEHRKLANWLRRAAASWQEEDKGGAVRFYDTQPCGCAVTGHEKECLDEWRNIQARVPVASFEWIEQQANADSRSIANWLRGKILSQME